MQDLASIVASLHPGMACVSRFGWGSHWEFCAAVSWGLNSSSLAELLGDE